MKIKQALLLLLGFLVLSSVILLGFKGSAVDKTEAPTEVKQLVKEVLEDNSWLSLKTEQEFRTYCKSIYCEALVEHMTAVFLVYVAENQDWHTLVKVKTQEVVEGNSREMQVLAKVEYWDLKFEADSKPAYYLSGEENFLLTVKQECGEYRIAGIKAAPSPEKVSNVLSPYTLGLEDR